MTLNCLPQLNVTALILMITRHNFYFHTEAYALKFEKTVCANKKRDLARLCIKGRK